MRIRIAIHACERSVHMKRRYQTHLAPKGGHFLRHMYWPGDQSWGSSTQGGYCTGMWHRRRLDWWMDLLTRLVSTSNDSATANLHNSWITTSPAKPFPASCVFTGHYLVTASNNGDSSVYALKSSLRRLPYRTHSQLNSWLQLSWLHLLGTDYRKHRTSTVAFLSFAAGTCLELLPRNGRIADYRRHLSVANNRRIKRKDTWSTTAKYTKLNTAYGTFKLIN
jgi:hypothetical protein